jgi:hypothetical protein
MGRYVKPVVKREYWVLYHKGQTKPGQEDEQMATAYTEKRKR